MAYTINILSTSSGGGGFFQPFYVQFGISETDAQIILSNPNALNFDYVDGNSYNINNVLYPFATGPIYYSLWGVYEITAGNWVLSFVVSTSSYFTNATVDWLSFSGPYSEFITGQTQNIIVEHQPQQLMPAYNPITFSFYSPRYDRLGYRYLATLKNETDTIGIFKVVPLPNGSGYIDVSSILSSYVSHDFDDIIFTTMNSDANNSYINYSIELGEEYVNNWEYTNLQEYTSGSTYNGYTLLNQPDPSITHTYVNGDQITIDTVTTGESASANGLHTVVEVPNNKQVVIDLLYEGTGATISVTGTTSYSDNRKTGYSNLESVTGLTAFNGAIDWREWKDWDGSDYTIVSGVTTADKLLLTTLTNNNSTTVPIDNRYMVYDWQYLFFNFYTSGATDEIYLEIRDDSGNSTIYLVDDGGPYGNVKQFKINIAEIITNYSFNPDTEYIEFNLANIAGTDYSKTYRVYLDKRCAIEETQIIFMDRMGSILSIPLTLRQTEKITVDREEYKQQIYYYENNTYDTKSRGSNISHVEVVREWQFNTNWMNDEHVRLFEEMITSPYTWIKFADSDNVYACIVQDKDYEVTKQKNKRLIKKSVMVKLANNSPINI